ncbi:single-stranded DNA-binding protein [Mediterranea sp. An20]|jgi:single-strand DNA-binding protein|uniref:single-stranded DNA-binding protein n=1 Tax=Mediterranea sp. An20 TaxID=1965586 RepID=UPI000B36942B|nr:single-stranded DNA-binding protein [Mediterranea sp. An20]OUP07385.1 single-stranded DNA-binding protein [Mediterranea sp. An20]
MGINKVILVGNVGQEPKVTYYEGGSCVAQLSLATTEKGYTLQSGIQVPDRTEWHNLIFRNRLGEVVEKYVHKGDKLYVEGKIRTRSYDDQAGAKRYVTEIFVDVMEMLSPKPVSPQQGAGMAVPPVQATAKPQNSTPVQENLTDDLPF